MGALVIISTYFGSLFSLLKELWLLMLFGFIIAAIVREFAPIKNLLKYFGGNDIKSLLRATIAGLFVSVCSCGAIPIAVALREKGASTASTLTFLLGSPWAGLLHLFILSGFIGVRYTILLFGFSLFVAFICGMVFARLERNKFIAGSIPRRHKEGEEHMCLECAKIEEARHREKPLKARLLFYLPRGLLAIFVDVGKYILMGALIAAALKSFVPATIVTHYLGNGHNFLPVLIAVPISAVIELCSEGFTLLAGQLFTMGASLGVVFTMTMVGVSTDFTELSMIWGKFGKRTALVYLGVSTFLVVCFAFLLNVFIRVL